MKHITLVTHLLFFSRREVVFDVEGFADLFRCFAFDHICDRLTRHVQQTFDVEVIRSLKEKQYLTLIIGQQN